jgi:hypothetical protein
MDFSCVRMEVRPTELSYILEAALLMLCSGRMLACATLTRKASVVVSLVQ